MPTDASRAAAFATPVVIYPTPGVATKNITTATTTLVKTGAGTFLGLNVNTAGAGSDAKVYDGLDAGGTLLGKFSTAAQGANAPPGGWPFAVGLTVVTENGTPADVTVSYL